MLIEQTLDKLHQLKLTGMAHALSEQLHNPECQSLAFEDRLGLLVDREWDAKESRGLARRLQTARLKQPATVEDLDFHTPRGLDKAALLALAECNFIKSHHNLIITGPTGVGKSYLACAIANRACRLKYSARCFRLGNLLSTIALARADGRYPALMRRLERTDLLVLDDWGLYPVEWLGRVSDRHGGPMGLSAGGSARSLRRARGSQPARGGDHRQPDPGRPLV
jgi:DNA replication protein DnaC